MKIKKERYGNAKPKIEQDDIEGGDYAVLTIASVEEQKVTADDGERTSLVLTTEELGDKVHWLNQTQIGYLIEKLGDDSEDWVGQRVPFVKTTSTMGSRSFKKVWIAAPGEWDDLLGTRKRPVRAVRTPAVKARARGRGKK